MIEGHRAAPAASPVGDTRAVVRGHARASAGQCITGTHQRTRSRRAAAGGALRPRSICYAAHVMSASIEKKPWWVAVSLWRVPTRPAMWLWFWCSIASAIGSTTYGIATRQPAFYAGALLFVAAVVYWKTIRWMDAHRAW